jgi:hypothetical protein
MSQGHIKQLAAHLNYGGLVWVGQCGGVRHESVGGQLPPGQGNTHLTLDSMSTVRDKEDD